MPFLFANHVQKLIVEDVAVAIILIPFTWTENMDWSLMQAFSTLVVCAMLYRFSLAYREDQSRWIKGGLIALSLFAIHLGGYSYMAGRPTSDTLPSEFIFIRGVVQEPTEDHEGKIYMWIRVKERPDEPKSFELPYSQSLAEEIRDANEVAESGEIAVTTVPPPPPKTNPRRAKIKRQTWEI